MGEMVRAITADGMVMGMAIDGTDLAVRAREIHRSSPTATAALGRALMAASMMGSQLKASDQSLTLQIRGDGPFGTLTCVSDAAGNVRGYLPHPEVDVPRKYEGKLDVGAGVGSSGSLTVIKDLGLRDPYVGSVELVSGEIAEDITRYYAESEQIPAACGLGVLVRGEDGRVLTAGGYLIQLLPGADERAIEKVERGIARVGYVTTAFRDGATPRDLLEQVLSEFEVEFLSRSQVEYRCRCSRERVARALISLGREELRNLAEEQETMEITCQFCDRLYRFSQMELQELIAQL